MYTFLTNLVFLNYSTMSERRAKIAAQFLYFGFSCFYRTSVEMSNIDAKSILHLDIIHKLNLDKMEAMCRVICTDMETAHTAQVGYTKKNIIWKANGYFYNLNSSNEYIYVYCHQMHASPLSGVQFSELKACFTEIREESLKEFPICKIHDNHDFLAPYMMDNENLRYYYRTRISTCGDDENLKQALTKALAVLDSSGSLQETPFVSPSTTCNNWEENDWTLRLYYCLKDKYTLHYTASGYTFTKVLEILKCRAPLDMFCVQGYPDLIFVKDRVVVVGRSEGETSEGETSESERAYEASFQKPPLKGKSGFGPPEKLGELTSAAHIMLVVKYLKAILKGNVKKHATKGLLMDKQLGNVHVELSAGEWAPDRELWLHCKLVTNYVQLSPTSTCFNLTKFME